MVAARLATLRQGANQHREGSSIELPTEAAASRLNVGVATVKRARVVLERGVEASEIVLLAKARIGELTAEVKGLTESERGKLGGRGRKLVPAGDKLSRSAALDAEGLTRKDAAACEAIRRLKDAGDLVAPVQNRGARGPSFTERWI